MFRIIDAGAKRQAANPFARQGKSFTIGGTGGDEAPKKKTSTTRRDYKERDFQTDFSKWMAEHMTASAAVELKVTPDGSLPFNAVQPHQVQALLKARHDKLVYKIPDDSMVRAQRPFDCFILNSAHAYIGIMFHAKNRAQKTFYLIDIDDWVEAEKLADRKSITEEKAGQIGHRRSL